MASAVISFAWAPVGATHLGRMSRLLPQSPPTRGREAVFRSRALVCPRHVPKYPSPGCDALSSTSTRYLFARPCCARLTWRQPGLLLHSGTCASISIQAANSAEMPISVPIQIPGDRPPCSPCAPRSHQGFSSPVALLDRVASGCCLRYVRSLPTQKAAVVPSC